MKNILENLFFLALFSASLFLSVPAQGQSRPDPSAVIFQAMKDEMDRSLQSLKIDVFDTPYFILYQIRQQNHLEAIGSFGALLDSQSTEKRTLFVDVKIGDPKFDSSTPGSHRFNVEQLLPKDDDPDALRRAIWYETDLRYKQAIMNYLKKKGRFISGVESHEIPDFSRGNSPAVRIDDLPEFTPDVSGWENLVRTVSLRFREYPEIEKSKVRIVGDRYIRHYLDSEGNKIRDAVRQYAIFLEAWTKTESGSQIYDQDTMFFIDPGKFPSEKELTDKVDRLIEGLLVLKKAPKIEPYVGPAIFSPDATAVLFHEAIGHRLEGDRLRTANDGKTFMKKVGERILPSFLTLIDNPRMETFKGENLLGHYLYDDEGQESQEVVLVNRGVLKNFLLSRTPILHYSKTNGHARSDGVKAPMSRMSNFILRSEKKVGLEELKQRLIEEVKRQNKPYGLLIKKIISGETQTEKSDFQVFKGKPVYLYKVYPDDGREELVRNVEFVGTPLSMVNKVILTGNDAMAIHGYCGAESGILPVTSITPSVLLSEVELQTANEARLRPPILPPPPVEHISH